MSCAYRFRILEFMVSDNEAIVRLRNTGVAPIYRDACITVNGVRAGESLITLQPGETRLYLVNTGGKNPVLSIECDHLVKGQKIEFEADIK